VSAAPLKERAHEFFGVLQDEICERLAEIDGGATFHEDRWEHASGERHGDGGGVSRVLSEGRLFEKAGVNLAAVSGQLTERLAERLEVDRSTFFATGISLVVHPLNPWVPTVHMNCRYLELPTKAWFGGGADLTPYYLFRDDARHFHRSWKTVCDRYDDAAYPRFKRWCDEYFFVKHRGEARGIGGIFFDYLAEEPERVFDFVKGVGREFLNAYVPIVERRSGTEWWDREREWQLVRRGRYVEFNLVHDRGTLFGLETQGRTESILMSLPPLVRWRYDHRPEPGSREAELLEVLREPRDWL
jgi:coproporphyrinogen III oxidase